MKAGDFRQAIARQCGMADKPMDNDDIEQFYAEEQARHGESATRQYEHTLFSKAANKAFEYAPIKLATASPSEGGQTEET